jgi:lipoprotein-anchoring transpeptidase ErfK/SrfK
MFRLLSMPFAPMTAARLLLLSLSLGLLTACASAPPDDGNPTRRAAPYAALVDGDITIPAVDGAYLRAPNRRANVAYDGPEAPGTIVVDPFTKFLYLVEEEGRATRYPIAVGREGRGFRGRATVQRKEVWPGWAPTANMLRTEPEVYGPFAAGIPGGVASPLGARSLYLYRGGRDTRYRIHGTNDLESIGNATTAGCIRLFNQDIIDLFDRTPMGTEVVVRTYEESLASRDSEWIDRGVELPPRIVDPDLIYAAVEAER